MALVFMYISIKFSFLIGFVNIMCIPYGICLCVLTFRILMKFKCALKIEFISMLEGIVE